MHLNLESDEMLRLHAFYQFSITAYNGAVTKSETNQKKTKKKRTFSCLFCN